MTDLNDLTQRVTRIENALAAPILPKEPGPGPEPKPRPDLPVGFAVATDSEARLVGLTWGPLSENTPGVEVQRRGPGGWSTLTKTAKQGWRDAPPSVISS